MTEKEIDEFIEKFIKPFDLSDQSTIIDKVEFLQIYKHDNIIDMKICQNKVDNAKFIEEIKSSY